MAKKASLVTRLSEQLKRQGLARDAACLVGYSCGADSTALVHLLMALPHPWALKLHLGHFNHGLRPESKEEERFAKKEAKSWGLPLYLGKPLHPWREDKNLELWARQERWAFFEKTLKKTKTKYLLLAHHADDVVETALMRMMEGAGPGALVGLRPERGAVQRPLVGFRKSELLDWLNQHGKVWKEDDSNRDLSRFRNRVRHELVPVLEQIAPGGLIPFTRTLETLREEMGDLEEMIERGLKGSLDPRGNLNLSLLEELLPPSLALRALSWHLYHHGLRPNQSQLRQVMAVYNQTKATRPTGQRKLGFLGPGGWEMSHQGLLVKNGTKNPENAG